MAHEIRGFEEYILIANWRAEFPDRLDDKLNRALDDRRATLGGIEMPASEELAKDGAEAILRAAERLGHSLDDLTALSIWALRSVVDEKSIELLAEKSRRLGLGE